MIWTHQVVLHHTYSYGSVEFMCSPKNIVSLTRNYESCSNTSNDKQKLHELSHLQTQYVLQVLT